ncbi:hypothetical protein B8W96_02315 [Lentilactobacillus parakefiri]|nr:hypothetical protein B8W96_02315 [Lentilactobacillus parakefiri]
MYLLLQIARFNKVKAKRMRKPSQVFGWMAYGLLAAPNRTFQQTKSDNATVKRVFHNLLKPKTGAVIKS